MTVELDKLPDQGWTRVLCVVAHPDDMEYGASAAVSSWTRRGIEVGYLLLTAGEAGMDAPPEEIAPLRAEEQRHACDRVRVSELTILNHPDGMLTESLELRRDIARVVRTFKPDAVVTTNFDVEAYGGLNQADHRVAGIATADGVRDADNDWVFRELADQGLHKWHTKALLVAGHDRPTHALAVDPEDVAASVASLRCHQAYLQHVTGHPDPGEFIPQILSQGGQALGTEHAVTFRVYDLGGLGSTPD